MYKQVIFAFAICVSVGCGDRNSVSSHAPSGLVNGDDMSSIRDRKQIIRWSSDHKLTPLGGGESSTHIDYEKSSGIASVCTVSIDPNGVENKQITRKLISKAFQDSFSKALESIEFTEIRTSYDDGLPVADVKYYYLNFETAEGSRTVKCSSFDKLPNGIDFVFIEADQKNFFQEGTQL